MTKSLISALVLSAGILGSTIYAEAEAHAESAASTLPRVDVAAPTWPKLIALRKDASKLESFAANEVRRFVYLRTGKLLPLERGATAGDRIVVSCRNTNFCGKLGNDLSPQQFTLKTMPERLKKAGDLWADFWQSRQRIEPALAKLKGH